MDSRRRKAHLALFSLALLLVLSCRFLSDGIGGEAPVEATLSPTAAGALTASPAATATQPPPEAPTQVIVTVTDTPVSYPGSVETETLAPYPGPVESLTQELYPGPVWTETTSPTSAALTQTEQSLLQTMQADLGTPTPPIPTPSPTLAYVPTFTPTLPGLINLTGLWYGYRKIEIKFRDCEESVFHNLRWRIFQDNKYNLLVNGDLSGYLKGNVVVLSGIEYFEGGTLNLTYILTVGPTEHRLSGYFYGSARLPDVCGRKNVTGMSVPGGWIEVER